MTGAVVCDLDGVVYRGSMLIPGSDVALRRLDEAGLPPLFVTNNSARPPGGVKDKLAEVVGYQATPERIVTSALVAASLIATGPVLIVGGEGISEAVTGAGFALTEDPAAAKTVVVGLDRDLSYERVARAATAVREGAELIVTNRDPTFPTEGGLLPGAGACAAAVETAAGSVGITAGKPMPAMRALIEDLVPEGTIWMIGDRVDTDIALAAGRRWRSVLVMTGVTERADKLEPAPDHVAADLAEAVNLILGAQVDSP
ncbi:MAG: HAD-IIA family hydrolase [Actinomycetota bacterium]